MFYSADVDNDLSTGLNYSSLSADLKNKIASLDGLSKSFDAERANFDGKCGLSQSEKTRILNHMNNIRESLRRLAKNIEDFSST